VRVTGLGQPTLMRRAAGAGRRLRKGSSVYHVQPDGAGARGISKDASRVPRGRPPRLARESGKHRSIVLPLSAFLSVAVDPTTSPPRTPRRGAATAAEVTTVEPVFNGGRISALF
jgi:hypothetical protein